MSSRLIEDLGSLKDVRFHAGAGASLADALASRHGLFLVDEHRALLEQSNGIEAFAGYIRLFGVQTTQSIDAVVWNDPDCWKFAWGDRCSGYWCFAETAWGDQYAYSLDHLRTGGNVPVYFLDALSSLTWSRRLLSRSGRMSLFARRSSRMTANSERRGSTWARWRRHQTSSTCRLFLSAEPRTSATCKEWGRESL